MNRVFTRARTGWTVVRWVLGGALFPPLLWACTAHPLGAPEPMPQTETDVLYDIGQTRKLDLVFLIDDSGSMGPKQEQLARNFPAFIAALEGIEGGLPDLRIAIVSSSFGAGPGDSKCPIYGDKGRFLVRPNCGLDGNAYHWLEAGGTPKTQNFKGELADVFSCLAKIGDQGCGYEHQLQALRASLYDVNPENAGFLRDDALLGIVILSDEDDCSAEPFATIFDADPPEHQSTSLICSLVGHEYQAQPGVWRDVPAMEGFSTPLTNVRPYERQENPALNGIHAEQDPVRKTRLINVPELAAFIKAKKGNRPERLLISAIIGWPDDADHATYQIGQVTRPSFPDAQLDNVPICHDPGNPNIVATAGIRFKAFMDAFGEKNAKTYPICQDNLTQAVKDIGKNIHDRMVTTCVTAPLVDTDAVAPGLQAECQVADSVMKGDSFVATPLPACSTGKRPCWELAADDLCDSHYRVDRQPIDQPPPAGTVLSIKCLTCTSPANGKVDPRCAQ
jgi:hypothetical protein